MLLGYTAGELNRLVTFCAERKLQRVRETLRPGTCKYMFSQNLCKGNMIETKEQWAHVSCYCYS